MAEPSALRRIDDLRAVGRFTDAERLLRSALEDDPDDAHLLWRLAAVLHSERRFPEGIEAAEAAVVADPANSNGHRVHALLLAGTGLYDDAVHASERAIALSPAHAHSHVVHAYTLQCAGRHVEAVAAAREAVALAPSDPECHLRLGDAARGGGDRVTARVSYHEALRLDPEHAEASRQLALLDESRHPGRGLRRLIAAGRHSPDLPGLLGSVAKLLWRIGAWLRLGLVLAVLPVVVAAGTYGDESGPWVARGAAIGVLLMAGAVLGREARHLPKGTAAVLRAALRADIPLLLLWVAVALGLACFVGVAITGDTWFALAVWLVALLVNSYVALFFGSLLWPWRRYPLSPGEDGPLKSVPEFLAESSLALRVALCFAVLLVVAVGDPSKRGEPAVPTTGARLASIGVLVFVVVLLWRGARHLPESPVRAVYDAFRASVGLTYRWLTVCAALGLYLAVAITGYAYYAAFVWVVVVLASGLSFLISRAVR